MPGSVRVEPAVPPADINLHDLAARIGGLNLQLRAVEAELSQDGPWSARRLERLPQRLKKIMAEQRVVARYYKLVPDSQRLLLPPIESPRVVIAQLGRRIYQARARARSSGFIGTAAERRAELARLDVLSEELASLAVEPPQRRTRLD